VFDTLAFSRKAANLRANSRVALVIGGWNDSDPRTVQYEGVADFPTGAELERLKQVYFAAFLDTFGTVQVADKKGDNSNVVTAADTSFETFRDAPLRW
jgi:Pyridoxamine 5'-phosphate oxidase